MTKYVLQYFKVNGRVGGIRLMLDYKKVPFTDEFISSEQWPAFKEKTPFGQVPVLVVNDGELVLPETMAIYRYLANKHGLVPEDPETRALSEAYGDHLNNYMTLFVRFIISFVIKSPAERVEEYRNMASEFFCNRIVPDFAKQLKKTGTGFLFGKEPTWVDFLLADTLETIPSVVDTEADDQMQVLMDHRNRVFALPGLEKRLEERKAIAGPGDLPVVYSEKYKNKLL